MFIAVIRVYFGLLRARKESVRPNFIIHLIPDSAIDEISISNKFFYSSNESEHILILN